MCCIITNVSVILCALCLLNTWKFILLVNYDNFMWNIKFGYKEFWFWVISLIITGRLLPWPFIRSWPGMELDFAWLSMWFSWHLLIGIFYHWRNRNIVLALHFLFFHCNTMSISQTQFAIIHTINNQAIIQLLFLKVPWPICNFHTSQGT